MRRIKKRRGEVDRETFETMGLTEVVVVVVDDVVFVVDAFG